MAENATPGASDTSNSRKLPWKPMVAGINALVFGPVAGGLVASANLRRMGQPRKAKQILVAWLPATVFLLAILHFSPSVIFFAAAALGVGVACMLAFTNMQKNDFALWEQNHPQTPPANGWGSLGLGLLGLVILVISVEVIFVALWAGAWRYFGD